MATLNIVMVEPEIPQNTGNVARTCAATGARLHLVGPMGFKIDDKKLKRAGLDYWHMLDITMYNSLNDFLKKIRKLTKQDIIFQQKPNIPIQKFLTLIIVICFLVKKPPVCRNLYYTSIPTQRFVYL